MNRLHELAKILPTIALVSAIGPFPLALLLMVLGVGFVEVVSFYVVSFYATAIPLCLLAWRGVGIRFNR